MDLKKKIKELKISYNKNPKMTPMFLNRVLDLLYGTLEGIEGKINDIPDDSQEDIDRIDSELEDILESIEGVKQAIELCCDDDGELDVDYIPTKTDFTFKDVKYSGEDSGFGFTRDLSNLTWSGFIHNFGTFDIGDNDILIGNYQEFVVCSYNEYNRWELVENADQENSTKMIGMYIEKDVVLYNGYVRNDSWDFEVGKPIYIGSVVGKMTQEIPTQTKSITRCIGYALDKNIIHFNPSSDWVVNNNYIKFEGVYRGK